MIQEIQLENFLCHHNSEFKFENGLNLVFGKNGVGKTSLFYAIHLAITGKNPVKHGTLKQLIHYTKDMAVIILRFLDTSSKDSYLITRTINRYRDNEAKLVITDQQGNQKDEVEGITGVNSKLQSLFRFRYDLPQTLFHFKEGEIGHYLGSTKSERRKELVRMFGFDRIEEIQKELEKKIKLKRRKLKSNNKIIKQIIEEKNRLEITTFDSLHDEEKEIKRNIWRLERKRDLDSSTEQKLNRITIKNIEQEIQIAEESLYRRRKKLQRLVKEYGTSDEAQELINNEEGTRSTFHNLQIREKDLMERKMLLESNLELKKQNISLLNHPKIIEEKQCPTCKQALNKLKVENLISILTKESQELEISHSELNYILNTVEKDLKRKQSVLNRVDKTKDNFFQYEELQSEIKKIKITIKNLKDQRRSMEKLVLTSNLVQEKSPSTKKELAKLFERLDELKKEKGRIEEREKKILKIDREFQKLDKVKELHEEEEKILTIFLESTKYVLLNSINYSLTSIVDRLDTKIHPILKEEYDEIVFNYKEYYPNLVKDGKKITFSHSSAGQRVLLYLALRLSIVEDFNPPDFLLIDSPSAHLDSIHSIELREKLNEIVSMKRFGIGQAIVSTNDSRFSGSIKSESSFIWNTIHEISLDENERRHIHSVEKTYDEKSIEKTFYLEYEALLENITSQYKLSKSKGDIEAYSEKYLGSSSDLEFIRYLIKREVKFYRSEMIQEFNLKFILILNNIRYGAIVEESEKELDTSEISLVLLEYVKGIVISLGLEGILLATYFPNTNNWIGFKAEKSELIQMLTLNQTPNYISLEEVINQ